MTDTWHGTKGCFWVGEVAFLQLEDDASAVRCAACGKKLNPEKSAQHAHKRHRAASRGVLAGQLGLPFTNTPDVPR